MASTLLLSFVVIVALVELKLGGSVEFNYNISDATYGPNGWAKTYKGCSGSKQSPIDIETSKTEFNSSLGDFKLENFDSVPSGAKIEASNDGHGYKITVKANTFTVSGGGLTGKYSTAQFHFHWGSVNTKGSEHTVDKTMYPAELHFVNYNVKYSSLGEAVSKPDGLAVLGVIYEVGSTENKALTSFLQYAAIVSKPSKLMDVPMPSKLDSLLPSNKSAYYRYMGGLTTPTCNEVVTWTVFKQRVTITASQLNMLRGLKQADNTTALTDTFRPVQPLNSRVVKRSYGALPPTTGPTTGPTSGAYHVSNTMATVVSVVMAISVVFCEPFLALLRQ